MDCGDYADQDFCLSYVLRTKSQMSIANSTPEGLQVSKGFCDLVNGKRATFASVSNLTCIASVVNTASLLNKVQMLEISKKDACLSQA